MRLHKEQKGGAKNSSKREGATWNKETGICEPELRRERRAKHFQQLGSARRELFVYACLYLHNWAAMVVHRKTR